MRGSAWARFALVIVVLLPAPLRAARVTSTPTPEMNVARDAGGFVLSIHNPLPYPVTVTIEQGGVENLRPRGATFPITATVEPQQHSAVARLMPVFEGRRTKVEPTWYFRAGRAGARHDDRVVYTLPFEAGYAFRVCQGYFGKYSHQDSRALDFLMPQGTPICAARDGRVISVTTHFSEAGTTDHFKDKANEFSIMHDDGTIGRYAHLREGGTDLRVGDYVRAGYPIGYSGNTGFSAGPHLHFDVLRVVDAHKVETVPVKFVTADVTAALTLEEGGPYMRPYKDQPPGQRRAPRNADQLAADRSIARNLPMPPITFALTCLGGFVLISLARRVARLMLG